jgi:hypothetical protein
MAGHVANRDVADVVIGESHLTVVAPNLVHRQIADVYIDAIGPDRPWQQTMMDLGRQLQVPLRALPVRFD